MSDLASPVASRSVVAIADLELLRVARTDTDGPEVASPGLGDRMRRIVPVPHRSPIGRLRVARRTRRFRV